MQVDFYHLTRDPAEKLIPILAQKTLDGGQRMIIVSGDFEQIEKISEELWRAKQTSFLAHAIAGAEEDQHQPILINDNCVGTNGAKFVVIADGEWRDEAMGFDRAFYLFAVDHIDAARSAWRDLSAKEEVTTNYWKQDGGNWVKGP